MFNYNVLTKALAFVSNSTFGLSTTPPYTLPPLLSGLDHLQIPSRGGLNLGLGLPLSVLGGGVRLPLQCRGVLPFPPRLGILREHLVETFHVHQAKLLPIPMGNGQGVGTNPALPVSLAITPEHVLEVGLGKLTVLTEHTDHVQSVHLHTGSKTGTQMEVYNGARDNGALIKNSITVQSTVIKP